MPTMIPQLIILAIIVCHFSDEDLLCFKEINILQSIQALPSIGPGMVAWGTQFYDLQPDCSQLEDKQVTHADALSSERRRKDLWKQVVSSSAQVVWRRSLLQWDTSQIKWRVSDAPVLSTVDLWRFCHHLWLPPKICQEVEDRSPW